VQEREFFAHACVEAREVGVREAGTVDFLAHASPRPGSARLRLLGRGAGLVGLVDADGDRE
jgi:hypothetical protein